MFYITRVALQRTNVRHRKTARTPNLLFAGPQYVFTNAACGFQYLRGQFPHLLYMLATNASLWFQEKSLVNGTLVQFDHRNESTGFKFTRWMQCDRMPKDKQEEDEKCTTVEVKVAFSFLFILFLIASPTWEGHGRPCVPL